MSAPMTVAWIERPTAHLAVDIKGQGAPLVFLHAGVCDKRSWQDCVNAFAQSWLTIAYDRRGYGETTCNLAASFSHLDDLDAVLSAHVKEPVVLVGCSRGGGLAIDYALRSPEKVRALVVIGTALTGQPTPAPWPIELADFIERYEAAEQAGEPDRLNKIECHAWLDGPLTTEGRVGGKARALFLDMNARALAQTRPNEVRPPSAFERLGEIKVPTLVICGDLDFPDVEEACRLVATRVPGAKLEWMQGVAHLPMLECPERLNVHLTAFLKNL